MQNPQSFGSWLISHAFDRNVDQIVQPPVMEGLEQRQLLSVSAPTAGPLAVPATAGITVKAKPSGPVSVSKTEVTGDAFRVRVGSFHFRSVDLSLKARIDWGDGTHSAGKITGDYGEGYWKVIGKHTYDTQGTYQVRVTILSSLVGQSNNAPHSRLYRWTSTIEVNDPV